MDKVVGIGEYAISNGEDSLKTFALASCVAITAYDPFRRGAGMIHIALPTPLTREDGERRPGYYATTGIPILLNSMCWKYGSKIDDLQIKLYGGAVSIKNDDYFHIGQKNIWAVRDTLSRMNLNVLDAQIGGTVSRSLKMDVLTGVILITTLPINI